MIEGSEDDEDPSCWKVREGWEGSDRSDEDPWMFFVDFQYLLNH